jgi:hypothetical protein
MGFDFGDHGRLELPCDRAISHVTL